MSSLDDWDVVRPTLEQRLYEAAMDSSGIRLTAKDVQTLVALPWVDAWITDRAITENGGVPATLCRGLVETEERELETWNEFKRRVADIPVRGYMQIAHIVPSGDGADAVSRVITVQPEPAGLGIYPEGTGTCEMMDCAPIFVEFWEDRPRAIVWPDINDPEAITMELDGALESKRRPDVDADE